MLLFLLLLCLGYSNAAQVENEGAREVGWHLYRCPLVAIYGDNTYTYTHMHMYTYTSQQNTCYKIREGFVLYPKCDDFGFSYLSLGVRAIFWVVTIATTIALAITTTINYKYNYTYD